MAFPDENKRKADPFFLGTWSDSDGPKPRRSETGFLFRVEPDLPTRVLVQSVFRPDWDYAFQNARQLLEAPPVVREFDPALKVGLNYRFRLAMLMVKRRTAKGSEKGKPAEHPIRCFLPSSTPGGPLLPDPKFTAWREKLTSDASRHGFELGEFSARLSVTPVRSLQMKPGTDGKAMPFNAAMFEGELRCVDAEKLKTALVTGIGRGKAFGMGLLSLAVLKS